MNTKFEKLKMNEHEAYWLFQNGIWVGRTSVDGVYRVSPKHLYFISQLRKWWNDKEEERERKRNRR
jgi:hypothetical protein